MGDEGGPVLVIGATGQQGGAAARALLDRGRSVRALVRNHSAPAAETLRAGGATLVSGDLDDPASLRAAADGVTAVFLALTMMTGPRVTLEGVAAEERRGKSVADIARAAGIRHLVYTSSLSVDKKTGISYYESKARIEEYISSIGLPATFLRPTNFMDNFATLTRPELVDGQLVVRLAIRPQTRMHLVAARDIGVFAAIALGAPDRFVGRAIGLAGDDLSGNEIAATFGRVCGLPARFEQVPIDQIRAFDPEVAKTFEWMDKEGTPMPDLAALKAIHSGLMTLETWLRTTGWKPEPPQ